MLIFISKLPKLFVWKWCIFILTAESFVVPQLNSWQLDWCCSPFQSNHQYSWRCREPAALWCCSEIWQFCFYLSKMTDNLSIGRFNNLDSDYHFILARIDPKHGMQGLLDSFKLPFLQPEINRKHCLLSLRQQQKKKKRFPTGISRTPKGTSDFHKLKIKERLSLKMS